MIGNARGSHSSPGIYMKEVDLSYASKSLGITTLGVVGETLKGPAFEPIRIENWNEFVNYFGGTSTELFKGTKYPKYELPYIAKTYLKNSKQLEVCRVLGLSGYNAGPAWVITAEGGEGENTKKYVVAVLRSRGSYEKENAGKINCTGDTEYDKLTFFANGVEMKGYTSVSYSLECETGESSATGTTSEEIMVKPGNYGRFTLVVTGKTDNDVYRYPVSLNPGDKDYILNQLGTRPDDGVESPIFVEELYDVAFMTMVDKGRITQLTGVELVDDGTKGVNEEWSPLLPQEDPVYDLEKNKANQFEISDVGLRYLSEDGKIKTVEKTENGFELNEGIQLDNNTIVYVTERGTYYKVIEEEGKDATIKKCGIDANDYKESYRCASTPWVVSELKGDGKKIEVKRLFRFHTISDGAAANTEVKVSIQNIRPDEGLFDVVVRKFDDIDGSPVILEKFGKCSMVPGTSNFIGFKIGTFDGEYMTKSKYITVEVKSDEITETCIPAGFLGYPIREFTTTSKTQFEKLDMGYNYIYKEDINVKKQYFGFSNLVGIDADIFRYKGKAVYEKEDNLSKGFHLDSRITTLMSTTGSTEGDNFIIMVDGKKGFEFQTVDAQGSGRGNNRIGSESEMEGTIYENVNLRKFTVCFYGGFDGWDPYRTERTNSDIFKANKYAGSIVKGVGRNFGEIKDPESLGLSGKCITTDYYAYLSGAKQFDNIEAVDINMFATPGIDYVNQPMLSREILEMIEDERGDSIYVMTTPDKDVDGNMIYPYEAVSNLEDAEIDSNYAATYYPWVKYFDADNNRYINLPATKDALAAMAYTDNVSYPWFAPAGTVRGNVECERAAFITKLDDEDTLYEGRINPIKTFAVDGVKIWGQKTMYGEETPLNRINVRRLMLRIKKLINGACRRLIFEQNDTTVKAQFEGLVRPILDDIKTKRGIYDYRLQIDDSPEARDRQELPASILIKPTKALEYIDITFTIMPESVSFDE